MRSVILITPNDKMLFELYQQWKKKTSKIWLLEGDDRLSIVVENETIYVDQEQNAASYYEDNELKMTAIQTPYFYQICYSDKDVMQYFLINSVFDPNSFFDNDHGDIVPLCKLQNMDILSFIE